MQGRETVCCTMKPICYSAVPIPLRLSQMLSCGHRPNGSHSLGSCYYTTLGSMKLATGGALRDDDTGKVISLYAVLQGNFGPDWCVASHVNIAYPQRSKTS